MNIGNESFNIEINETNGCITGIKNNRDDVMNWCAEDGKWGRPHKRSWDAGYNNYRGRFGEIDGKKAELCELKKEGDKVIAVYDSDELIVTVTRYFAENGRLVENYKIKNKTNTVIVINRDNFGIEVPFNDRYPVSTTAMKHNCTAHIWCGHNVAWINAIKIGRSDINLGLYVTCGAIDCYDQDEVYGKSRGVFVLAPESVMLNPEDEYEIEWELFWHTGTEDFLSKIKEYENYIDINAEHYTVFENEKISFSVEANGEPEITLDGEKINTVSENGVYKVEFIPPRTGDYKFIVNVNGKKTWVNFTVKINFEELLKKRVRFIVKNQQCRDKNSPLYGAFMVYDNDYDSLYFDDSNPDHNACRERMNIPLLLMKYLQRYDDAEVREAINIYMDFVLREFYDEETGEVFNTIGKRRNQIRLYNGPGVMTLFCEMYFITRDEKYLQRIMLLAKKYYSIGGENCYANGFSIFKVMKAFEMSGNKEDIEQMKKYFKLHTDTMIKNGPDYPEHEAAYEQTIVTPAVQHICDMGMICDNKEFYLEEAKKHLENLEAFSGMQPDCKLNEIAVRFWDGYWFGKNRINGDTLPHHLSVLTARAYLAYSRISGDNEYIKKAEECIRNCMCLIRDDGRGSAAYVYPYKLDGKRGECFDPWSNDQDLVLYDALYASDVIDAFNV